MEPTLAQPTEGTPDVVTDRVEPVATRIIVKYVENEAARVGSEAAALGAVESLTAIAGVELRHVQLMADNAQVVEVVGMSGVDLTGPERAQAIETIQSIAERIAADPAVEYAEPDAIMQIQQAVSDPLFGQQWHYTMPGTGVNLVAGWSNSTGSGVTVAVIDTGYRPHADLLGNLSLPGFDFVSNTFTANDGGGRDADASDPGDWVTAADIASSCPWISNPRDSSWHGTHVAGTVAAVTNNALGVAGVARSAKVVPVRVLGKCGGSLSDITAGMRWGAGLPVPGAPANPNPAQVINLSLGGSGACGPTYQSAVNAIVAAGTTVVVAAGNANANASGFRPANCSGVVTVAATNQIGARSWYSNFGSVVEIAAPGGETQPVPSRGVLSTLNAGATTPGADSYAFYQGTSMAAPHVAGVAALLYQLSPGISPAQVSMRLQNTAQPFPTVSSNQCSTSTSSTAKDCGAGIVDSGAATDGYLQAATAMPWLMLLLND